MTAHTKGPWKLEPARNIHADHVICSPTENTVAEVTRQSDGFAELDPTVRDISTEEGMANARLITAAPEMHAALKIILPLLAHQHGCLSLRPTEEWDGVNNYDDKRCKCAISVVKAALAKAVSL